MMGFKILRTGSSLNCIYCIVRYKKIEERLKKKTETNEVQSTPVRFSIGLGCATRSKRLRTTGLMSITKGKNRFADYHGIPRTGSREPVRTP